MPRFADVIKGNVDEWMVRGIQKGEVPAQAFDTMTKERDWALSQLDDDDLNYLDELPISIKQQVDNIKIFAFHATPQDLFEVVTPDAPDEIYDQKIFLNDADIYFYGHIHKAYIRYIKGKTVVNLGSVGMPFDGVTKASYALLDSSEDGVQTSIIKVTYDMKKVIRQIKDSDYPNKDFLVDVIKSARV